MPWLLVLHFEIRRYKRKEIEKKIAHEIYRDRQYAYGKLQVISYRILVQRITLDIV